MIPNTRLVIETKEREEVKRKLWVLAQALYSPQGNGRQSRWNRGIDHPTRRITQGAGIVKGLDCKGNHAWIPDTFT